VTFFVIIFPKITHFQAYIPGSALTIEIFWAIQHPAEAIGEQLLHLGKAVCLQIQKLQKRKYLKKWTFFEGPLTIYVWIMFLNTMMTLSCPGTSCDILFKI
jgi:hypothetical protein